MELIPIILIVLGIIVLVLGRRLSVLGAAVGALVGVILLRLLPGTFELGVQLLIVLGLALGGFFAAAFARGVIDVVILVIGALAGAGIALAIVDLFKLDLGLLLQWVLVIIGAVIGFMIIRRGRRGSRDWGMILLASLVGSLLIVRGLAQLFPSLQDTVISTLLFVGLALVSIIYQGGFLSGRKAQPVATVAPAAPAAPAVTPPATEPPQDKV
jgi:hypothetical protein